MNEQSIWLTDQKNFRTNELKENITTEIAVIGAGITGSTTAYFLAKSGKKVVLLDKATPKESVTAYTTAFLTQEIDTDITELVSIFGEERTRIIWESHGKAIDAIEEIINQEKIDCEFIRCPAYIYANNEKEWRALQEQAEAAKRLNFNGLLHKKKKIAIPHFGCLEIHNQAKFHPMKYINGLLQAAERHGAAIHFNTEAVEVSDKEKSITTKNGTIIHAEHIILATYLPLGNPIETFAKKGEYVSYVLSAEIEKNTVPEAMYWDMHNPYHYFRVDKGIHKDRLIIGGNDHRKEIPFNKEKQFEKLALYLAKIMQGRSYATITQWSGPIIENISVALIGKVKHHTYVATGFSGNGMTYSMIAGILLRDSILGKKNIWENIYDPKIIPTLKQIGLKAFDYTEELINEVKPQKDKYVQRYR